MHCSEGSHSPDDFRNQLSFFKTSGVQCTDDDDDDDSDSSSHCPFLLSRFERERKV